MTSISGMQYVNMKKAAEYLGVSYRWMQRNYPKLIKAGVQVCRVPKGAPKGRLMFHIPTLENYMNLCKIKQY